MATEVGVTLNQSCSLFLSSPNGIASIVGVSNQLSWLCIGIASLRFRAAIRAQNLESLLPFKNWTYPFGPIIAVVLNIVLILVQGWSCFSPRFKVVDFFSYYIEIPIMIVMFLGWKLIKRTRFVRVNEMDLVTDRFDLSENNLAGFDVSHHTVNADAANRTSQGWKSRLFAPSPGEKGFAPKVKRFGMWLFL